MLRMIYLWGFINSKSWIPTLISCKKTLIPFTHLFNIFNIINTLPWFNFKNFFFNSNICEFSYKVVYSDTNLLIINAHYKELNLVMALRTQVSDWSCCYRFSWCGLGSLLGNSEQRYRTWRGMLFVWILYFQLFDILYNKI
jgi:hypothetical protein